MGRKGKTMKRKAIKRAKRKVKPYKHTIGYYEYHTYRSIITGETITYKVGWQERVR